MDQCEEDAFKYTLQVVGSVGLDKMSKTPLSVTHLITIALDDAHHVALGIAYGQLPSNAQDNITWRNANRMSS
eukprot:15335540-Ditylum_brightwellii.AAC.1